MTSDQNHLQSSLDGASWTTELQNLSFNQNGALTSQRLGSASNPANDYSYHIEGWLAAMNDPDNLSGGRHLSASWRMAYQANGNVLSQRWRQSMNLRSSALQYNYAYNALDFLTSAAFSGGGYSSSAYDVTELAYDLDGNFTRIRRNNQTGVGLRSHLNLSYSAGTNKISQMIDPNPIDLYNFGYDAAGNINLASHLSLSGASYDERNLPVEFNYGASKRLDMGYDSGALRVYKADQLGNTTHFVRDVSGNLLASYYNGALRYHGLLGPDGSPDFIGSQANGTSRYYFLKDHLGSVRTTVDFSNTALGYDDYYPFGKVMPGRSSSSSTPDDDYKFTGHQRDAELDLDYMLARNYDPLIGRFMQVDPLAMDYPAITPYGYVMNNPLGLVDSTGMAAEECCPGFLPIGIGVTSDGVKAIAGDQEAQNRVKSRVGIAAGIASLFIPGPEDLAVGAFLLTKTGQTITKTIGRLSGEVTEASLYAAKSSSTVFRSFTKSNFRTNLGRLTGNVPANSQAHHIFPQKYQSFFNRAGVNIHDPKFGA